MENLVNAASNFLNQQGGQQGQGNNDNNQQQQQQQNNQGGGGGGNGGFDIGSLSSLIGAATNHSQQQGNNQDSSMFSQIASRLQNQHQQGSINPHDTPDEQKLVQQHEQVVNGNESVGTGQIGNAAALSAIKSFLGGSGGNQGGGGGGGGSMQSQMIGLAMSHAASMFDQKQSQGLASGNKNDAVQQAGEMAMKLMMKNQLSGMIGGGNSGGLGGLASLAGKLM